MSAEGVRRGSLFGIGGRESRSGDMPILERFVERCGGSRARIVVLTTASAEPAERASQYDGAFRALDVEGLQFFHQHERADGDAPELMEALEHAEGVFLAGGNQLKLVTMLGGTSAAKLLRKRHLEGLHLAGTSAGASALSTLMIARGKARSAARLASLRMTPGLGVLPRVIVDQHFSERDRFGRLLAAVLCNPEMLGFGLDEDTAFELDGNDRVGVVGRGALTIVDGTELEASNLGSVPESTAVAFAGMRIHVLTDGWSYDLAARRVQRPAQEPHQRDAAAGC